MAEMFLLREPFRLNPSMGEMNYPRPARLIVTKNYKVHLTIWYLRIRSWLNVLDRVEKIL